MSSLLRVLPVRQIVQSQVKPAVICNVARNYADYRLEELIPGPYPESKKDREAAAKKYGLMPVEYQPYPDDGFGKGDYPMMPKIGGDARGVWYPWDYPEHRKDFGDPWHIEEDLMQTDRWDPNAEDPLPTWQMVLIQIAVFSGFIGLFILGDMYPIGPAVLEKQYPGEGVTNYSFEPLD